MRILIIHNQLWAHYKGKLFSEIYAILKSNYPNANFKVVHIALYEASRTVMQDDSSIKYEYPNCVLFQKGLDSVSFISRLIALFKAYFAYKPTVLNITGYFDWAQVLLMFYARSKGVKVVLSSESSSMDNKRVGIKESLKSKIVNAADAYFCFGTSSVEYLKSLGVPNEKITVRQAAVIDEKVILEAYQKGKSEKQAGQELPLYNFVYVGRLAPEKNLLLLLKAYQNVREVLPEAKNWGIIFVGDGTERKNLTDYAGQNKLAGVNFAGGFPWHKVPEWLAHSSVLVLPSLSEPWGLVVNEAMLCGLPVVVSNKCGCVEDLVQNGINGYSFHPASQQELEIILKLFINDPERIKPMGEASRKIISPFSSEKVAKEMVTTYHQLSVSK